MKLNRKDAKWFVPLLASVFLFCCLVSGCGVINGIGADTENIGRFPRTASQKGVDSMEMKRISDGIATQNRLMQRGQQFYSVK